MCAGSIGIIHLFFFTSDFHVDLHQKNTVKLLHLMIIGFSLRQFNEVNHNGKVQILLN
jgi:hypothetical protein